MRQPKLPQEPKEGEAAMFVEMPPKGTQRRRRGQCRPRPVMHQMRGQGKVPQNAREEKSCEAHELTMYARHIYNTNMGGKRSHIRSEAGNLSKIRILSVCNTTWQLFWRRTGHAPAIHFRGEPEPPPLSIESRKALSMALSFHFPLICQDRRSQ